MKKIIAPSLLSANFLHLDKELLKCKDVGIEWIHYDVMDYHFVPNLTFGSKILSDLNQEFRFNVDIHFMVEVKNDDFDDFFKEFIKTKPKMMTMHYESLKTEENIKKFVEICHENKILASLAISPKTSCDVLLPYLHEVDNVLVMSVEPGFGGQAFIPNVIAKIKFLDHYRKEHNLSYSLEIDGGINEKTSKEIANLGLDMVVAGSYFFNAKDPKQAIESLNFDEK